MSLSEESSKRLWRAIEWSRQKKKIFSSQRAAHIKQYVGMDYGDEGSETAVQVNLLALAAMIYLRKLASNCPRALLTSKKPATRADAFNFGEAFNEEVAAMRYGDLASRITLDALFGMGICFTGMQDGGYLEIDGFYGQVGKPFCVEVSLEDWFHDMTATDYRYIQYAGHLFTADHDSFMADDRFKQKDRDAVQKLENEDINPNVEGEERPSVLGRGASTPERYKDQVRLAQAWLPGEDRIVIFDASSGKYLGDFEHEGPEGGPYDIMGFWDVPENVMPLPPASLWSGLHETGNALWNKLVEQGRNQKTVLGGPAGSEDDMNKIIAAKDLQAVILGFAAQIKEHRFNGPDQASFAMFLQTKDLYSWLAGNLDSLGGLGPMADTLGGEELLQGSSSEMVRKMQDRVVKFHRSVFRKIAWYIFRDPYWQRTIQKQIPGTRDTLAVNVVPDEMTIDFDDLDWDIEPYSLESATPASKLRSIQFFLGQFYAPFREEFMASGGTIDWDSLARIVARYMNAPEIEEFVKFSTPPDPDRTPWPSEEGKPRETKRTYERVNRPGATRGGKDSALITQLMGGGVQPAESAAMGRPVG